MSVLPQSLPQQPVLCFVEFGARLFLTNTSIFCCITSQPFSAWKYWNPGLALHIMFTLFCSWVNIRPIFIYARSNVFEEFQKHLVLSAYCLVDSLFYKWILIFEAVIGSEVVMFKSIPFITFTPFQNSFVSSANCSDRKWLEWSYSTMVSLHKNFLQIALPWHCLTLCWHCIEN